METPKNVLPFRPLGEAKSGEAKSPVLTPVENSAFNELARQLSARLENENIAASAAPPATPEAPEAAIEQPAAPRRRSPSEPTRLAGAARAAARAATAGATGSCSICFPSAS